MNLDAAGEAGLREPLHVIEHGMDVDRLALDRPLVGEHLHAVDELHDPVGLVANQPRQRAVVVAGRLFEQLRRAANAGQRVLDLVREHGGERAHRARRAAMGELAVHLVGDGALLQHHHDMVGPLGQRRDVQIDQPVAGIARRREIDLVFVHRRAAMAHLLDQREQRAAERHQVAQHLPAQQQHRSLEKALRRDIGVGDPAVGCDDDDGQRQGVEHRVGGAQRQVGGTQRGVGHAAALQAKAS